MRRTSVPAPLSMDLIAKTALEIVDRQGVAAMTMRTLAGALDVSPMALYNYFPSRAEVLQAATVLVWNEAIVATNDVLDDPVEFLVELAIQVRKAFGRHGDIALEAAAAQRPGDALSDTVHSMASFLELMGLNPEQARQLIYGVFGMTLGTAMIAARRYTLNRILRPEEVTQTKAARSRVVEDRESSREMAEAVRAGLGSDRDLTLFTASIRALIASAMNSGAVE